MHVGPVLVWEKFARSATVLQVINWAQAVLWLHHNCECNKARHLAVQALQFMRLPSQESYLHTQHWTHLCGAFAALTMTIETSYASVWCICSTYKGNCDIMRICVAHLQHLTGQSEELEYMAVDTSSQTDQWNQWHVKAATGTWPFP